MAKFKEKIKARKLRKDGESIKVIAKKLKVSNSIVSIWCRDIKLTQKQIAVLEKRKLGFSYKGRIKGARILREKYLKRVASLKKSGKDVLKQITKRDLFIAGLCLYWGEGSKTGCSVRFHNSDPLVIKFMMQWFKQIWRLENKDFTLYFNINEIHRKRLDTVRKYWSKITTIPESQFRKPILVKAKTKKVYENFNQHFGTLSIRVNKSSNLFYKIQGQIEKISQFNKAV